MTASLSTTQKIRKLPWPLAGDTFNVAFCYLCIAGPVFLLYLDSLGLDKTRIGMVLSFFSFCGLIALFTAGVSQRVGPKRVFISMWAIRKFVAAALIGAPWVLATYGPDAAFYYVAAVMLSFSLCRAIGEASYYSWNQEFVPATIRGKYSAIQYILIMIGGMLTVGVASRFVRQGAAPDAFIPFLIMGVVFGFVSVVMFSRTPGGAPVQAEARQGANIRAMARTFKDKQFRIYLIAIGMVQFGATVGVSFVPLFMKEEIGLAANWVVALESAALFGGLCTAFMWGWVTDRYGSKPVMVCMLMLFVLYPLGLLLLPRQSAMSLFAALGLTFFVGLLNPGWSISANRHLFVSVVPTDRKASYMAVYYAWVGLIGGIGPLVAGRILDHFKDLDVQLFNFTFDRYAPVFLTHLLLLLAGAALFSRMDAQGAMPVSRFASMFLQGNPLAAMQSLVAYNWARNEGRRITTIERLGRTRSPLSTLEMIQALDDPSFNVRLEAIVTIARMRPDDRLIDALLRVLEGPEPDLAVNAAWALGRLGDRRAIGALRQHLTEGYPLLASHCARALATLNDREVIPLLLARFRDELDEGLRFAYASSLGALRADSAMLEILDELDAATNPVARRELALALARIIGDDAYFIRLWRRLAADPDTATAQALLALKKRLCRLSEGDAGLPDDIDAASEAMASGRLDEGTRLLAAIMRRLKLDMPADGDAVTTVLAHCAAAVASTSDGRVEYLVLMLHALDARLDTTGQTKA